MSISRAGHIDRAYEILRWRGVWCSFAIFIRRILRPVFDLQVFHIVETDIEAAVRCGEPVPVFPVRIFTWADGVDFVTSEQAPILALERADVAERLREGDEVAVAYCGKQVIGCAWAAFHRRLPIPHQTVWNIKAGEAVLYRSFVLPEWRGKRVHRSLDHALNINLHKRGIERGLGSMSVLNPQTLSLARRNGRKFVMKLWVLHVPALNWTWRHAQGRPWHAHFDAARTLEPVLTTKPIW
jgi:GNAT superfamily N-acetyltransferase